MDKRFFLKEVIVDSRKNQQLSSLGVKLQGPMLVPCGGLLQLGWPRPRLLGPQLCARPTRVGLGSALGKTRLKIREPGGRHRFTEMRKSRQATKADLVAPSRFGPILVFHIQGGKNLLLAWSV